MSFAARLEEFGDRTALVGEDGGRLSYAALARRADAFAAAHMGGAGKQVVLLRIGNDMESVVRYLGALRAGHAVILTGEEMGGRAARLIDLYRPDICVPAAGEPFRPDGEGTGEPPHPDLALCLSTSGSTGATKLVRLSLGALDANARAIADYLALGPDERAIASLPLHYSFGLSVLHSHLAGGGGVVLTERGLADPAFWDLARREGATSLAGVPHSFDLMDRMGVMGMDLPDLRTLTQAGGRLSPETVRRYGRWARDTGRRLVVMYGQTEAAPRMAWLPPARLPGNEDCIGVPVPGGAFALIDEDGRAIAGDGVAGELVYRGPNVMMGYAFDRTDLGKGPEIAELRTGDMAERRDGLYRIVGRRSRFCKPFGLRVGLDELEAALADRGVAAAVAGDDELIAIACEGDADAAARRLARDFGLPATLFEPLALPALPRLPSGKVDYPAILRQAMDRRAAAAPGPQGQGIAAAFAQLLGRAHVGPDDSFVTLEGDSLSYVAVASEIDRRLGYLPEGWEQLTIARIDALAPRAEPERGGGWKSCESETLLRACAITGVVANHASTGADWHFAGGADVLMILVGFNLARFNFARLTGGGSFDVLAQVVKRIILPYCLILWAYGLFYEPVSLPSLLLVSNFVGRFHSFLTPYWFMEALFQCMALIALLFALAPVRRWAGRDPFGFGLAFLGGATALKAGAFALFHHARLQNMTPDAVLPLIALGWLLFFARGGGGRRGVALVAACLFLALHLSATGLGGWDFDAIGRHRIGWMAATLAGLLFVPRLPLPAALAGLASAIAGASFTIYLVHVFPVHALRWGLHVESAPLITVAAMALGVALHTLRPRRLLQSLLRGRARERVIQPMMMAAEPE